MMFFTLPGCAAVVGVGAAIMRQSYVPDLTQDGATGTTSGTSGAQNADVRNAEIVIGAYMGAGALCCGKATWSILSAWSDLYSMPERGPCIFSYTATMIAHGQPIVLTTASYALVSGAFAASALGGLFWMQGNSSKFACGTVIVGCVGALIMKYYSWSDTESEAFVNSYDVMQAEMKFQNLAIAERTMWETVARESVRFALVGARTQEEFNNSALKKLLSDTVDVGKNMNQVVGFPIPISMLSDICKPFRVLIKRETEIWLNPLGLTPQKILGAEVPPAIIEQIEKMKNLITTVARADVAKRNIEIRKQEFWDQVKNVVGGSSIKLKPLKWFAIGSWTCVVGGIAYIWTSAFLRAKKKQKDFTLRKVMDEVSLFGWIFTGLGIIVSVSCTGAYYLL